MTLTIEASTELTEMLEKVSYSVRKQFQNMELADLQQEAWLWLLENKKLVREHEGNVRYLWSSVRNHLVKYTRSWLAIDAGYEVDDQVHYTIPQIRQLLQQSFTPDWVEKGQAYDSQPTGGGVSDPSEAWVMVADVTNAFRQLMQKDKDLLWQALGEPGEFKQHIRRLALEHGVAENVLAQRVNDALSRLRRHLGGGRPA